MNTSRAFGQAALPAGYKSFTSQQRSFPSPFLSHWEFASLLSPPHRLFRQRVSPRQTASPTYIQQGAPVIFAPPLFFFHQRRTPPPLCVLLNAFPVVVVICPLSRGPHVFVFFLDLAYRRLCLFFFLVGLNFPRLTSGPFSVAGGEVPPPSFCTSEAFIPPCLSSPCGLIGFLRLRV